MFQNSAKTAPKLLTYLKYSAIDNRVFFALTLLERRISMTTEDAIRTIIMAGKISPHFKCEAILAILDGLDQGKVLDILGITYRPIVRQQERLQQLSEDLRHDQEEEERLARYNEARREGLIR